MQLYRGGMRAVGLGAALIALTACSGPIDFDLRSIGNGFDTSEAVQAGVAPRPGMVRMVPHSGKIKPAPTLARTRVPSWATRFRSTSPCSRSRATEWVSRPSRR